MKAASRRNWQKPSSSGFQPQSVTGGILPPVFIIFSSAPQDLFGGRPAGAVPLHAFHHGETYGRAASRDFEVSLESVQRQLDRFERAGAFISKRQGRTLVDSWNPKSRIASRLRDLVGINDEGMSPRSKDSLFSDRRQPTPSNHRQYMSGPKKLTALTL